MTPDELRTQLERLGLTQGGVARLLDVDPRTVRRWAAGVVPIPKPVNMLLERLDPGEVARPDGSE